jgi:hypothetical protein
VVSTNAKAAELSAAAAVRHPTPSAATTDRVAVAARVKVQQRMLHTCIDAYQTLVLHSTHHSTPPPRPT